MKLSRPAMAAGPEKAVLGSSVVVFMFGIDSSIRTTVGASMPSSIRPKVSQKRPFVSCQLRRNTSVPPRRSTDRIWFRYWKRVPT